MCIVWIRDFMNTDSTRPQQSPWLNSLVHQRGKFILAIPVSCLLASVAAFGWLQFNTAKAEYWVQHTQQVRLEAQQLLTALLDAEMIDQSYHLTRRREFHNGYKSAITLILKSLEQLNRLVADNPSQTQQIQRIQVLAQAEITHLERTLQLANSQPENVFQTPVLAAHLLESQQVMARTRAEIAKFLAEEERLQVARNQHLSQQRQLTWLVLSLSAFIGISGSLIAAYLLNRLNQILTERERNLRETEARYRVLVENFPN